VPIEAVLATEFTRELVKEDYHEYRSKTAPIQ
jgi:hypothetical protein